MIKIIVSALSLVTYLSLTLSQVSAASFALTKIGALDLGGKTYPEWWYTAVNPTLYGTGEASKEVTILIGSDSHKVTADSLGNWAYYAELTGGDYDIKVSQGSSSYSFKLHLGQGLPANLGGSQSSQTTQSTGSVPLTGYNQIAAIGFGVGLALLASYFYISGDVDKKSLFEKRLLNEDR